MERDGAQWEGSGIGAREVALRTRSELSNLICDRFSILDGGKSEQGFAGLDDLWAFYRSTLKDTAWLWRDRLEWTTSQREEKALEEVADWLRTDYFNISFFGPKCSNDIVETLRFLEWLDLQKWAISVVYSEKPNRDRRWQSSNGKRVFNVRSPKDVDRALHFACGHAKGDYAVLVGLYRSAKGKTKREKCSDTLFIDFDRLDPRKLELKPTVVVASSHGRFHGYYRLTSTLSPSEAKTLSRELSVKLGGDPACHTVAGGELSVPIPGLVRKRFGKPLSVPTVLSWDGPEYEAEDLRVFCSLPTTASENVFLAVGEVLTKKEQFTQWKLAEAVLLSAKPGERFSKLKAACLLLAPYTQHGLDPRIAGRIVTFAKRLWPECEETIISTVRQMFKSQYRAFVPEERRKRQDLDSWAGEMLDRKLPVIYDEAVLTKPEGVTDREARLALTRTATARGWEGRRTRYNGSTTRIVSPPPPYINEYGNT
ncbi:hypothetical protein EON81_09860 [bacterium]|nr:MAG: hypothetical protein EON81_09860 [bacterium]